MVDEGNIHDTAVSLLERLKRPIVQDGLDLRVLRRLNDMNRLCTQTNDERCGQSAVKDLEWLMVEVRNELGHLADDNELRAVLKEMLELQKAKVAPWS